MNRPYRYLTFEERKEIEVMHRDGARPQDVAAHLHVHVATIYKELRRGDTGKLDANMRQEYSAELAQRRIQENFRSRGRRAKEEPQEEQRDAAVI